MKYSIVIPTYNHCDDFLKPCIESIIRYTDFEEVELIISMNGCTDETTHYVDYLIKWFEYRGLGQHIKFVKRQEPSGFAKAVNDGIAQASGDKIVLLNNDTVLLEQKKNDWLYRLDCMDISGVLTQFSEITKRRFAVFFCAMIDRKVFEECGLLNTDFVVGGNEDIDFCYRAEQAGFGIADCGWKGDFPIYHKGEGTMHDAALVQEWDNRFLLNQLYLAKMYNPDWYRWRLSNNYERAVFLYGDQVFPRETQRYEWANENLLGNSVLEIGCSTGYGSQFFDQNIDYLGLDYDPIIVEVAKEQGWGAFCKFQQADINSFDLGQYDTIIAFEVIEHLDNGLEIVEKLKKHCKRLLITVPHNEPKGFWGEHHKLHGLTADHFQGFEFSYINEHGNMSKIPECLSEVNSCNLMIGRWNA